MHIIIHERNQEMLFKHAFWPPLFIYAFRIIAWPTFQKRYKHKMTKTILILFFFDLFKAFV